MASYDRSTKETVINLDSTGLDHDDIADPMVAEFAPTNALAEAVGPFYDSAGVARRLSSSSDAVADRAGQHRLLACPTAEGTVVFPAFQFAADGTVLPGLERVVATMAEGTTDQWQVALWMCTPSEQLRGYTPSEELRRGHAEAVLALATQTAARWAH